MEENLPKIAGDIYDSAEENIKIIEFVEDLLTKKPCSTFAEKSVHDLLLVIQENNYNIKNGIKAIITHNFDGE